MSKVDEFDSEFGEQHASILSPTGRRVGVVTTAGPELTIEAGGKLFLFEWHSYFGPTALNKRGEPKELPARSPFWRAIELWIAQGKRLDENRRAIWSEPKTEDMSGYVRVGKNLYPKEMHKRLTQKVEKKP